MMSVSEAGQADADWQRELDELRGRLAEAEEILQAIAEHKVDAFVIGQLDDERVYTLKGADQAYQVILETINEGAATVGEDGTIFYCNPAFAALLHLPLEQVVGLSLANFVRTEDLTLYASLLEQGVADRSKGEVSLQTASGESVSVLLSCSSLQLDDLQGVCLVATDLTEQKRQADLVASESLARSILEQASAAMVVCNVEGQIIRANHKAHQLCGSNPMLHPFEEAFPLQKQTNDPVTPFVPLALISDLKTNEPGNQHGQGQEAIFVQPSGQLFHLLVSGATLLDRENQPLGNVLTMVDITAHKQMEETLREAHNELEQRVIERTVELLSTNVQLQQEIEERKQAEVALTEVRQRLSQSQESERLLLARELHDGPLQEVIGMAFDLLLLTQMLQEEDQLTKINAISNSVQKTARHLRLMAQTLRPPLLAHLGLAAALRAHIKQVQETKKTPTITFSTSKEIWSIPEETSLALLRIAQQSLQNSLQHSDCDLVEVRLHFEDDALSLEIQDNGRGFNKPYNRVELAREGHLGVVGMAERTEAIRGHFEVVSAPGEGTLIRVTLPKPLEETNQEIAER